MKDLLIKKVKILHGDGKSTTPSEPIDLLIRHGAIEAIGPNLTADTATEVWTPGDHAMVSPGWFDVGVQACDPGFEHREDLASAAAAAAAGGYTAIACFPNTHPGIHSKSEVQYVLRNSTHLPVSIYPIGSISGNAEGKDLAELYDMHAAGAIAFSDGNKPVQDAGLLLRALQYAQAFDGLVMNHPHHKTIASGGQLHEGLMSTSLGMKGLPALAETLMVQRDLSLLRYAGGRLHLHLLSTAESVDMVRAAKKSGLNVTASVAVANLAFTDEVMDTFDSNWKVLPPLRSRTDAGALLEGLRDGTIDFVCSNHEPWDSENKNLEFPYAEFGISNLETAFAMYRTFVPQNKMSIEDWVRWTAVAPRQTLGLPVPRLEVGAPADFTVFDPEAEWTPSVQSWKSKSPNNPLIGNMLKGRVLRVVATR
ncbi:MAG: dihydroorotase [Saprospiraceae bacterium]|nr:dihydroorotase [Saprospiraceae bacterium]